MWGQSKKEAVRTPGRGLSPAAKSASRLILDCPELWKTNVSCWSHPAYHILLQQSEQTRTCLSWLLTRPLTPKIRKPVVCMCQRTCERNYLHAVQTGQHKWWAVERSWQVSGAQPEQVKWFLWARHNQKQQKAADLKRMSTRGKMPLSRNDCHPASHVLMRWEEL